MNYRIIQQPELRCCANCEYCDETYEGECICLIDIFVNSGRSTGHTSICKGFKLSE